MQVFGTPTSLSFSFSSASVSLTLLTNICLISSSFFWSSPKNSFLLVSYVSCRLGKKANEIQTLDTNDLGMGKTRACLLCLKTIRQGREHQSQPQSSNPMLVFCSPALQVAPTDLPFSWGCQYPSVALQCRSPEGLAVRVRVLEAHLLQFAPPVQLVVAGVGLLPEILHVDSNQHFSQLHEVAVAFILNWLKQGEKSAERTRGRSTTTCTTQPHQFPSHRPLPVTLHRVTKIWDAGTLFGHARLGGNFSRA